MGQKIHPLGFRLNITQNYQSHWFATNSQYSQLVFEDQFLRQFLYKQFSNAGISTILITRKLNLIKIQISAAIPDLITTRDKKNNGLELLRIDLINKIKRNRALNLAVSSNNYKNTENQNKESVDVAIKLTKPFNLNRRAFFLAYSLAFELEKRTSFRKALRQAIRRSQRGKVDGIKIQISGRLNGAEIARTEWTRKGRVPLQTLDANIDYSFKTAKTIYGLLGIKIWVYNR